MHNLRQLLTETYGWSADCIRTLTDDGAGGQRRMPTRANMLAGMRWLAEGVSPGDVLFFSFSGHGAQKEDPHGYEEDGMNETGERMEAEPTELSENSILHPASPPHLRPVLPRCSPPVRFQACWNDH